MVNEAFFAETTVGPPLQVGLSNIVILRAHKARPLDRLVLGSSMEWDRPSANTPASGPNAALVIIHRWNHFNKRDSSAAHMSKLYPNLLRILVVARGEEYSITFPNYMDKKSYQCVAEDGMFISNHNFEKTTELVWLNL